MIMSEYDDNQNFGCLQLFLILAILTTFLVPAWACIWRNTQNEPPAITIGQATVEPTPNPIFIALIEQAKASAKVQVITAETDNEIKLRWNIHYMRRFWAYFAIPVIFIIAGLGLYIWGLRYGRQ
jgi:hypothetical protein